MPWDSCFGRDAFGEEDTVLPYVTDVAPSPGSVIAPGQTFRFRVVDETGTERVQIMISGELCHDGVDFVVPFRASSIVESYPFVGGVQVHALDFSVLRSGGWVASLVVEVKPFDTNENEGTALV